MSSENVEVVRRWLEAPKATQDDVRLATLELWDEDCQYYPVAKFPETRPSHGREEIIAWFAEFKEVWSDYEFDAQRIIDVGDDRVLACATMRASGRTSEVRLEGDLYLCFSLREGRIIREEDHLTLAGALRALGLEGETLQAAGLEE